MRIKDLHLQIKRALIVVFFQPADCIRGGLFGDGIAIFQPASAVRCVLVEEAAFYQSRPLQVIGGKQVAVIRLFALRLAVIIHFLPAHPFVIAKAAMEVAAWSL